MNHGDSFYIVWDTGASMSCSPDKNDFDESMDEVSGPKYLEGIGAGLKIAGKGYVLWAVHDDHGTLRHLKIPAYYAPGLKIRLLSVASLLQTYDQEHIRIEPQHLWLSGISGDPTRNPVTVPFDHRSNLPTSMAYSAVGSQKAAQALIGTVSSIERVNFNLPEAEKELLRWHYRLGHVGFDRVIFLLRSGVLGTTEASRKLHQSACRIQKMPLCAACQYGKQTIRSAPGIKKT
jgi:hypothetical protein